MADECSLSHEILKCVGTVLSVIVGGRLAIQTFRSNQWWDAKRKAYEKVISDLELCAHLNAALSVGYEELRYGTLSSSTEFNSELQDNNEDFKKASIRLRRQKDRSSFIFSDAAQEVLNRLWLALDECSGMSPDEGHFSAAAHYQNALNDFVLAARIDLRVAGLATRLTYRRTQLQQFFRRAVPWLKRTKFCYVLVWIWFGQKASEQFLSSLEISGPGSSKKPV